MDKFKLLLLSLSSSTLLFGQCTYNLDVNFDFQNKNINVSTNIEDKQKSLLLDIEKFNIENKKEIEQKLNNGANKLSFKYTKEIKNLDKEFIYLLNNWYPTLESRCKYNIKTNLAKEYKTVYENTNKEIDNFNFLASKDFVIRIKKYKNIAIKTYFLRDDEALVKKYMNKTIEYIKLYERKVGEFPYKEFKIVENHYQTGYSMPTFTLIGSRLLDKDYILNQSLGHEILHQYFGNSVFNNFEKGNWVEGLTTFLADDYYKKLNNTDVENRKIVLNQYNTFVNAHNEFPIRVFTHRYNKASSMIGYSKLAFVFHMLEKKIGEEKFNTLIKKFYKEYRFKEANLKDIALFFDQNTKEDLNEFFTQWFYKKGKIDFYLENLKSSYDKDGYWLSFDLIQNEKDYYKFDLPLEISTYDEKLNKIVPITKAKQEIKINLPSEVLEFTIDRNYDLFRKLSKQESFKAISSLLVEKELIAVVDTKDLEKYNLVKRVLPKAKIIQSSHLKFKDIKENSVVFLDASNEVLKQFYPDIKIDKNNSYLIVKPHIYNDKKAMAVLNFAEFKKRYFMMLKHFSKYSQIILSKDETKKISPKTQNGINIKLNKIPVMTKVVKKNTLKDIYEEIKDKRIIYVGESHDNLSDHLNQLRVIKALYENGKNIAIAMEMFQKPFQKDLDEYIAGKTTLDEFLKNTEYYKRWKYDYNLYKPIIDYAKENKIPLVALNIDRSINKQVSKNSLLSLNEEQKKIVPKEIDQSDIAYKKSLEAVFKEHIPAHGKSTMNIDNFYQSQLVWDETMAENIHQYIEKNPNKTVVVIAGSGHIERHHGIVSRVFRRNNLAFQVIINNPHNTKIGDIVLTNRSNTILPKEKKIGVALENSNNLTVLRVVEDSFGKKIEIKKKDKILKINEKEVKSISDIKRILYFIEDMSKVKVTVLRDGKIIDLKTKR